MKYTDQKNIQEKPVIVIEDCDSVSSSAQANLEEPVITIENDDNSDNETSDNIVVTKRSK